MRLRDRPLLPEGLDSELYFPRPALESVIVSTLRADRNVLLLGEAGAGKTTLMRRIAGLLEGEGRPTVFVNGALADDAGSLIALVAAALESRLPSRSPSPSEPQADVRPSGAELLRAVRKLAREQNATIMIDDLSDPDIGYDLFGRLRDELWDLGHSWAVTVRPRDSAALRTPPADAFWARAVEIPPLSEVETEGLLRLGLTDDEYRQLNKNRLLSGAHPRSVIRWVQDTLERGEDASREERPPQWHLEQASRLGRSEAMAVAELEGLGRPVSAQDPELLERLGWSRAYAQRILSNLETHGVLRSIPERRDAPGRPRKLYELNPTSIPA